MKDLKDMSLDELRQAKDETLEKIKTLKAEAQPILSLYHIFMRERNHLMEVYASIKEELNQKDPALKEVLEKGRLRQLEVDASQVFSDMIMKACGVVGWQHQSSSRRR